MKDAAPDFLSDEPSSAPETEAKGPLPETAAPEAPAKEPAAPANDPATPPVEPEPAAHHVPLATFLDMRDRLTATEREKAEAVKWREEQEAKARQQPVPDRNQDPEAWDDWQAQQLTQAMRGQTMTFSRKLAEVAHGKDAVTEAMTWGREKCSADPFFNQRVWASDDPVELVVAEWKRDKTLSNIGDGELDAFLAWKAQQAGDPPAQNHNPAPAIRASPAAPRPSLASAPAAGRTSAPEGKDGEATFNGMFG